MAKYGSDSLKIEIKDGSGGLGEMQDISADVLEFNGLDISAETEESHGFGKSWAEYLATGLYRGADITLKGFYDDTTSTGTDALLSRKGVTTEMVVTWGGTKTSTFDVLIKNYKRLPARGELTKYECTMAISGEVVEA